jgi:uncharacterized protein with PQ loop repeat
MIGYIAGALTTVAFAPQLLQALTTKSTKDVSLMMLLCSTSGMILWLIHGMLVKDPALVVANSISVVLASSFWVSNLRMTMQVLFLSSVEKPLSPITGIFFLESETLRAQLYI